MLTFTHTYLLNLLYKTIHNQNIPPSKGELILGNIIPDFITHLGREQYQALAHNLNLFLCQPQLQPLEWGAVFHILCDNYSTVGKLSFEGDYDDLPRNGFIETLAQQVTFTIPLNMPKRRILQCAFDIFVIRQEKQLLMNLLRAAESYLRQNYRTIIHHISSIYSIKPRQLQVGLARFSKVYGKDFIELAVLEEYRLFPLIRNLLNLNTLTEPQKILDEIQTHSELMGLIESNIGIVEHNWHELLEATVGEVIKFPGIVAAFT